MRKFSKEDGRLHAQMAAGHLIRTGHHLEGYWTDGELAKLVRTCCEKDKK